MNEITAYEHGREDAMGDLGDRLARVTAQRDDLLTAARLAVEDSKGIAPFDMSVVINTFSIIRMGLNAAIAACEVEE